MPADCIGKHNLTGGDGTRTSAFIETDGLEVVPATILETGHFDVEKAHEHQMWAMELRGSDHVPETETEEYGVTSRVYRARRPFDHSKVMAALNSVLHDICGCAFHGRPLA